jgi:hypothetical protein
MSVSHRSRGATHVLMPPARAVLRLNAYAAIALGVATLFMAVPIGRAFGLGGRTLPAIAGLAVLMFGLDELAIAVGRRVRKHYVLPFAAVDIVACIASLVVVVAAGPPLSAGSRAVIALGAATFGWFAYADLRAMRSL